MSNTGVLPLPTGPFKDKSPIEILSKPENPRLLERVLFAETQRQYAYTVAEEAARYGYALEGYVADPFVLRALRTRAQTFAPSINQTYVNELVAAHAQGKTATEVVADRVDSKPQEIWNRELGLARHMALVDFYGKNGIPAMAHVEPTDAATHDVCEAAIDAGSVLATELGDQPAMPGHPGPCPHGWVIEPPAWDGPLSWTAGMTIASGQELQS